MQHISLPELSNTDIHNWLILDIRPLTNLQSGIVKNAIYFDIEKIHEYSRLGFFNDLKTKNTLIVSLHQLDKDIILQLKDNGFNPTHLLILPEKGVFEMRYSNADFVIDITADEFSLDLKHDKNIHNLDIRNEKEFNISHTKGAVNINYNAIKSIIQKYATDDKIYITSKKGSLAYTLACLLKKESYKFIKPISGGFEEISKLDNIEFRKKKKEK
jgi:rhodanese-related sulfurtransferase